MAFNDVIEKVGMAIDAAGAVVIVTGAAIAFVAAAVRLSRRESDVYRRFRQQLGQAILLGLELLVAGDIVRTVAASQGICPPGSPIAKWDCPRIGLTHRTRYAGRCPAGRTSDDRDAWRPGLLRSGRLVLRNGDDGDGRWGWSAWALS
jgi:hypothetical protein